MKTLTTTIAAIALSATAALAVPMNLSGNMVSTPLPTDGLFTLATTGWADDYAAEGYGKAFDKTGGMPGLFTYDVDSSMLEKARMLLGEGEFLAPHFLKGFDGKVTIMVAPHLLVDGMVVHGGNMNKDHFIVVNVDGDATRFDYSEDIVK